MSRSEKDQRGGHPRRHFDTLSCMCCPRLGPSEKSRCRTTRNTEAQRFNREAEEGSGNLFYTFGYDPHIYDGERCINCNVNCYDDAIYGPFECIAREPFVYTTSSWDEPVEKESVEA